MSKQGTISRRDSFIADLAQKLGRPEAITTVARPSWKHRVQWDVLKGARLEELVDVLKQQCQNIHTTVIETTKEEVEVVLKEVVAGYKGSSIVVAEDSRFATYGLSSFIQQPNVHVWNPNCEDNIPTAEKADIGITFCDYAIAESGTIVLCSSNNQGRSIAFLPTTYIAIIEKEKIVPRTTQVCHELNQKVEQGELISSCINFISGPSNSADIEMNLVVGVHGPLHATYILI